MMVDELLQGDLASDWHPFCFSRDRMEEGNLYRVRSAYGTDRAYAAAGGRPRYILH